MTAMSPDQIAESATRLARSALNDGRKEDAMFVLTGARHELRGFVDTAPHLGIICNNLAIVAEQAGHREVAEQAGVEAVKIYKALSEHESAFADLYARILRWREDPCFIVPRSECEPLRSKVTIALESGDFITALVERPREEERAPSRGVPGITRLVTDRGTIRWCGCDISWWPRPLPGEPLTAESVRSVEEHAT